MFKELVERTFAVMLPQFQKDTRVEIIRIKLLILQLRMGIMCENATVLGSGCVEKENGKKKTENYKAPNSTMELFQKTQRQK